jgi:hypothetical protein
MIVVTKRKEGGDSMNKFVIKIMMILFLLIGGILATQAEEINKPQKPEWRMKPPPEAIAACKGKSEGTAVQRYYPARRYGQGCLQTV